MNSEILFSMALGLQTPWQVKDVTFSTDKLARSELHLHIDFVPGSRFLDEANELCPVHDTVERQWQHLSFFEHTCYLHCAVPRITTTDGKVRTVRRSLGKARQWFYLVIRSLGVSLNRTGNAGQPSRRDTEGQSTAHLDHHTFLRNRENLSDKKETELAELITLYPTLGEAYRLKVLFNDLWEMPDKPAADAF